MKIAFYDTHSYDKQSFDEANKAFGFEIRYNEFKLNENTVVTAQGYDAVCVFVNDVVNGWVISALKDCGVKLIALRCAGFNNVDLAAAKTAGIAVVRVPAYSPHAVAEHGIALLMSLTRHIPHSRAGRAVLVGNLNGRAVTKLRNSRHGREARLTLHTLYALLTLRTLRSLRAGYAC